jgi:hypothetical protein
MLMALAAAAACGLAGPEPGYSIHVREPTAPERVARVRPAGEEAVLDAVGRLREPPADMGRVDVWVTRPGPDGRAEVLPVDWAGITRWGRTRTNFRPRPGDRLFLQRRVSE